MYEQEKELFESYEIKNWELSPRLYKILGVALVANLLVVLVAGQINLTQKGCDTPFVSGICQVLNTVYIGSTLLGTDDEYVSKEYVKNELEDADITYIDVSSDTPPLKYPEGYFALANPNDIAAMQNTDFPAIPFDMNGFPTNPTVSNGTDLMNTPQVVPTPNDNAVKGNVPDSPFSFGSENPTIKTSPYKSGKIRNYTPPKPPRIKNSSPKMLPSDEELAGKTKDKDSKDKTEEKQPDENQPPVGSDAVTAVEINKKPLEDFAETVLEKTAVENKQKIDLTKPFMVVMDGVISKDGKFVRAKSKYVKSAGDQEMIDVAKEAIEAIGNSGLLGFLRNLDVEKINFTLVQDDKQIYAIIASDQKSPERANTLTSGFNGLLKSAYLLDSTGMKKLGDDEKVLLNSAKTSSKD
ncbi:MAG TPA: hypothetical protein VNI60_02120, partial [Pyrinomonadaceae bacterium]|nr:hypothetical protein [Pyrinomonadaceae bacterium]